MEEHPIEDTLQMISAGSRPGDLGSFTLEFKQEALSVRETLEVLAQAAICFANAEGGNIVVGVQDGVRGREAFVGAEIDPLDLQRGVYERTKPALLVRAQERHFEGTRLVVVTVPMGVEPHTDTKGRAQRRVGTSCYPMSAGELAALHAERRGADWSAERADASSRDIDPAALAVARQRLRQQTDEVAALAEGSDEELLRGLGVVDGRGRLLRAGEVLFCRRDDGRPWVVYQHRPSPGAEAAFVERLPGPLLPVLERLFELVWVRRNVTPFNLPDGGQIEIADFPRAAIREALSNAVLHREFRFEGPITVEHSPRDFVVISPGPLVSGITENNILTHPSRPRNRCLFSAARKLRLSEETGRGVDRMYREMIRDGHDVPSITQTADATRVAFVGGAPRTQVVRFMHRLGESERDDVDTLLVVFTMLTAQTVTAVRLAPIIQKTVAEADSVLRRLAGNDLGVLEATRESARLKDPEYRLRADVLAALGDAVTYRRQSTDDLDRKVAVHVREYGRINNRTLRNLFDVDVYRARDLLRSLQRRGILVKTSRQQRGVGVEYGPGPRFPGRKP